MALERLESGLPVSWAQKYDPAMSILDKDAADIYFQACVQHNMRTSTNNLGVAQAMERSNLGYWGGYYSKEVRVRIEELFNCEHPILGKASERDWTPDEILAEGKRIAQLWRERPTE